MKFLLTLLLMCGVAGGRMQERGACRKVPAGDGCNSCTECWSPEWGTQLTTCTLAYCIPASAREKPDWVPDDYSESAAQGDPTFWQSSVPAAKFSFAPPYPPEITFGSAVLP